MVRDFLAISGCVINIGGFYHVFYAISVVFLVFLL
jgi:hypothetical protein